MFNSVFKSIILIQFILPNSFSESLKDTYNDLDIKKCSPEIEQGPCNIPIVTEPISQTEFLEKYAYSSPVVFRRSAFDQNRNKIFQEKCQLENLVKESGDKYVTVSSANTYSYKRYSMQLNEYLGKYIIPFDKNSNKPELRYGNETWYFFGENNVTEWRPLFDLYERPHYFLPKHYHAYSFGIAAFYTGVIIKHLFFYLEN